MDIKAAKTSLPPSITAKIIPVVENAVQLTQFMEHPQVKAVVLRHCNLLDLAPRIERAHQQGLLVYVNIDQIDGVHADADGLAYLSERCHVHGIVSNNPRVLTMGKALHFQTVQRVFAVDSTGLQASLTTVNLADVDLLDISPALVVPHLQEFPFPLPFLASGLIYTPQQVQAVLKAGAQGVAVSQADLWP
ncbi:glycerol-3-phosphate responsive antiterminator [Thermosporothrix hazakensis]|uniref:Glycerol-3-phosphate responsive antiterminator n=2 Tax=Thermosporothrix TaxID=768650 RepID=A0A326U432_THEHA|nr:glycerol-3-phosphate responsive antiterminator [Thermosporothrix hazakensis]PZW27384.1 glycerol-3-phosphate responsive antiterminator [Thermosporothrix hazakensis]BBH86020.1 hypothetical protein KTC_07710 [Thermosporothrix sp. COM3]GCE45553.1 hypothetical protein KTH_04220 [Thermosporothrix hazakensis]